MKKMNLTTFPGFGDKPSAMDDSGFTLLEMMIAVSIVAIVLTAVYRLHSQTLLMNSDARFQTLAPLLAQRKLADLDVIGLSELEESSGDFGEEFAGYGYYVTITDVESELFEKVSNNFKRIDVTIRYQDSDLLYNLRTYRYFPG